MARWRLLFGVIGAFACLVAALVCEFLFSGLGLSQSLDDRLAHVLIFRSDIARRLDLAGGKSGDVQITLAWNNRNDLDLWCTDPTGQKIWYQTHQSPSGGDLDVDANAGNEKTRTPVENIFWPYGHAPIGHYKVQVNYFRNHGDPDPTDYRCQVVTFGRLRTYTGTLRENETKTVSEFELTPAMAGWRSDRFLSLMRAVLITGVWASSLGLVLALGLAGGVQAIYLHAYRAPLVGAKRFRKILLYGALAGAISGIVGQALFNLLEMFPWLMPEWVSRSLGWVVMGLLLGRGLAERVPHLPRRSAAWAGAFGGMLGSWGYLSTVATGSDGVGRVAAAGALGLLIGLMIVLALDTGEAPAEMKWQEPAITRMRMRPLKLRRQRLQ